MGWVRLGWVSENGPMCNSGLKTTVAVLLTYATTIRTQYIEAHRIVRTSNLQRIRCPE